MTLDLNELENLICTNSIILCEKCNIIDKVKDGSFDKIILPKHARAIKSLIFYGQPTIEITEPYNLIYELYSEGFHDDITTYIYEIPILHPANGFNIVEKVNIKLYTDSPAAQFVYGIYPAEKINPYKNGIELSFYIQASKEDVKGLKLFIGVQYE